MSNQKIIENIAQEIKERLKNESSGHDWWHVYRVWRTAKRIGQQEKANMLVVELAALLHDIADWKFQAGDDTVGPKKAGELLEKYEVRTEVIEHVCNIIATMTFQGAEVKTEMETLEGRVVQDADRLDAIGAIGIGRAFAYGGYKNRPMHDPDQKPTRHKSKEEYYSNESTTINHFHEKLLLLKDRMNTKTARKIAKKRHKFMKLFLDEFGEEREGGK